MAEQEILITIRRIKEYSFFINEMLFTPGNSKEFKIEISVQLSFTIETNMVFLLVRVYYHYPDAPPMDIITDIQVQNVYEIQNLNQFVKNPNEIVLPKHIITTLVGVSLSHTRALLAKNILGTVLQESVMGIINPEALARHFFPNMFIEGANTTGNSDTEKKDSKKPESKLRLRVKKK